MIRVLAGGECAAAVLALGLALSGCSTCTEVGCTDEVRVLLSSNPSLDRVSVLQMCLNEHCVTVEGVTEEVGCKTVQRGSSLRLEVCRLESGLVAALILADTQVPRDGDLLTLAAEDGEGAVVFEHEKVIQYQDFYPNGGDCTPHCKQAKLSL